MSSSLHLFACMQVWPLDIDLKFLEPFGRELHSMKKVRHGSRLFNIFDVLFV